MERTPVVTPQPEAVIRVSGFQKNYHQRPAVHDLTLAVRRGEIYGLIGPDGAGKSSLMKAIAGVLTFDAGKVEVFGVPLGTEREAERIKSRIGFMPQGLGLNLYPELSIEENVEFFARLRGVPPAELAAQKERLLRMTRLAAFRNRPMKQLSGGMKQKLGLVCALIHAPELVILDEPTTGVDPVSRRDFWAILAQLLREQGGTALVSTAYLDEASRFDRLSLVHEGRLLASGTPEGLLELAPGTLVSVRTEGQVEALAGLRTRFSQVEARGPWLRVFAEGMGAAAAEAAVRERLGRRSITELDASPPELEDVFIALLRARERAAEAGPAEALFTAPAGPPSARLQIEAHELCRDFGAFRAVDRVSFQVRAGEIFGLLGANGAGKTTVIKILTGILPPTGGSGHVAGANMRRAGHAIKQRIGYMSQAFSLYQDLTVIENILLYAGIYGLGPREARERAAWVLEMGDLRGHEGVPAGSLPMGLRQRLALGCALVHRPEVLFLDEPTSGMDPVGRRKLWDLLFHLSREEGVAILVTTHYMSEAEHCDHLALMYAGRVVADASPEEMKRQVEREAGRLLEIGTTDPARALPLLAAGGFSRAALFGRDLHLLSPHPEADEPQLRSLLEGGGIRVLSVTPRPLSMEDVFVYRVTALEEAAKGGQP